MSPFLTTVLFIVYPGGVCNEPTGRGASVSIANQDWQRWRIVWDRTSGDWRSQSITWFMNDRQFHQVRGDQLNNQGVWESLTAKPLFFILNVAVGGNWVSRHNIALAESTCWRGAC